MVDVLFSFLCVLISIRCLGCSFKEIFRTLKDFLLLIYRTPMLFILKLVASQSESMLIIPSFLLREK